MKQSVLGQRENAAGVEEEPQVRENVVSQGSTVTKEHETSIE